MARLDSGANSPAQVAEMLGQSGDLKADSELV